MRIAISGAGIAGTALAYWLHRTGHTPTVIEQAPAFRSGGYMIDFWGVGYTVAQRMGIEEQIRDAGYEMEPVRSVGSHGRALAALDTNVFRHLIGDDFTSLPRGDLAAASHATIADKVEMIYSDSITGFDEHPDGVRLTFGHAGPREHRRRLPTARRAGLRDLRPARAPGVAGRAARRPHPGPVCVP